MTIIRHRISHWNKWLSVNWLTLRVCVPIANSWFISFVSCWATLSVGEQSKSADSETGEVDIKIMKTHFWSRTESFVWRDETELESSVCPESTGEEPTTGQALSQSLIGSDVWLVLHTNECMTVWTQKAVTMNFRRIESEDIEKRCFSIVSVVWTRSANTGDRSGTGEGLKWSATHQ